jgi:peptide/nickel transport system permease protein
MLTFLARRLTYNAFVLLGVSFLVFSLVYLGGDPARAQLPIHTPPEQVESFRESRGLNQPIPIQFVDFVVRAVQGDFGQSLRFRQPAMGLVLERLPATLTLAALGVLTALVIAIPLGTIAAVRRGTWIDHAARTLALLGQAVPSFVLAPVLILILAVTLRLLPVSGTGGPEHLVMPALAVGFASAAGLMRILRSSLLEVFRQDYIRTAEAKGLQPPIVLGRHAFKNAAIPVVTFLAFDIAAIMSGVVIVEVIFAYPGMGRLAFQAIANRDLPVIQAFVFLSGLTIVTANMLLDVVYTWLDPRIRVV